MSVTAYEISIPVLDRGLGILHKYVDTAEAFATSRNVATEDVLSARLAPDMLSFEGQVRVLCNKAERHSAQLAQQDPPAPQSADLTFEALRERIVQARRFLANIPEASIRNADMHPFNLSDPLIQGWFAGRDYILQLVLPDFFFHLATAHDILRHIGVDVGKRAYLGSFDLQVSGYS